MSSRSTLSLLADQLSIALKRPGSEIDPDGVIMEMGLDSLSAVTLTIQLEEMLDIEIEPTAILDHDTLNKLTAYIDGLLSSKVA